MGLSNYLPNSRLAQPGVCTSSTRPASPYEGQVIYETDTDRVLVYNNAAWVDPSTGKSGRSGLVKIVPTGATNGTVEANGDVIIGNAVSTVTVNDAFIADYDNYLIQIAGGAASANAYIDIRLGATTTGYAYGILSGTGYTTASGNALQSATTTGTHWRYVGYGSANGLTAGIHVYSPNLPKRTTMFAQLMPHLTNIGYGMTTGLLDNNTQYTSFIIDPEGTATMTGGTIRVYGYN